MPSQLVAKTSKSCSCMWWHLFDLWCYQHSRSVDLIWDPTLIVLGFRCMMCLRFFWLRALILIFVDVMISGFLFVCILLITKDLISSCIMYIIWLFSCLLCSSRHNVCFTRTDFSFLWKIMYLVTRCKFCWDYCHKTNATRLTLFICVR